MLSVALTISSQKPFSPLSIQNYGSFFDLYGEGNPLKLCETFLQAHVFFLDVLSERLLFEKKKESKKKRRLTFPSIPGERLNYTRDNFLVMNSSSEGAYVL